MSPGTHLEYANQRWRVGVPYVKDRRGDHVPTARDEHLPDQWWVSAWPVRPDGQPVSGSAMLLVSTLHVRWVG